MKPQGITRLEHDVIEALLKTDHPVFHLLHLQFAVCRVTRREYTGVGFFTRLSVPASVNAAGVRRLALSDVRADLTGLDHGAGFVLWIETGRLASLEGFSFDESWPEQVEASQVVGEHASGNAPTDLELVEAELNRR